ncbi:DUF2147 domain-containing protein [uncultured Lacinutrix sp.]|uniref:DUF2147 domain-containing protein n=1 Tax=uncultured Lacinutrix sp. TaxID=574032 RepID=UPI002638EA6E|nr:DUF2147 domain-containing protein [uncultured Lacinutrix sp.]
MNKSLLILLFLISFSGFSQTIFGKWKTVDTNDIEKSIVEIYQVDGTVFGKISEVLLEKDKNSKCTDCKGEDYNKPVLGMTIIKNLKKRGDYYKDGTIVDPNNGKVYKLRLCLDEDNKDILIVRGYIGFFYETQYWKRVIE